MRAHSSDARSGDEKVPGSVPSLPSLDSLDAPPSRKQGPTSNPLPDTSTHKTVTFSTMTEKVRPNRRLLVVGGAAAVALVASAAYVLRPHDPVGVGVVASPPSLETPVVVQPLVAAPTASEVVPEPKPTPIAQHAPTKPASVPVSPFKRAAPSASASVAPPAKPTPPPPKPDDEIPTRR
jgi:hypothetical protein